MPIGLFRLAIFTHMSPVCTNCKALITVVRVLVECQLFNTFGNRVQCIDDSDCVAQLGVTSCVWIIDRPRLGL
jgi:hypothetical protein